MEFPQIAAQLLEVITGWHAQILIGRCIINHLELAKEPAFDIGRNTPRPNILNEEVA